MNDDYRRIILDALPEFDTEPPHDIKVELLEDAGEYFWLSFLCF